MRLFKPKDPHYQIRKKYASTDFVNYRGLIVPVSREHMPLPIYIQISEDAYERPEILAAEGLVKQNDRVLEMGTGLGIVSGLISRMASGVTIQSYEANPSLLRHISDLHQGNNITNVNVTNAILEPNPTCETRSFHIHKYFAEGSIYQSEFSESIIEVPVIDLNAVIKDFKPTLMICDIEGAEEIVIPGCDLSTLRGVVMELHPRVMSRAGVKHIYDALISAGLYPNVELSCEQVVAFERIVQWNVE
ncbi:FkbM family methyltransferase [Tritonibacter mobilis]|uniref:FkbM family methyltransferase n=1 Tax=Tritonibacter mobilis TaxID=379347 RepID=UPI000806DF2C|nr:FkbM family methyltransferase [Tritonibacter mobilis]